MIPLCKHHSRLVCLGYSYKVKIVFLLYGQVAMFKLKILKVVKN